MTVAIREANDGDAAALASLSTQLGYPADASVMRERLRRVLAAWLLVAGSAWPAIGQTQQQQQPQDQRIEFDIPPQPLGAALEAFAATGGFQVFYETSATAQRVAPAVKGLLEPTAALRLLLHAARLGFAHPLDGRRVIVRSPLPADFRAALRS